MPREAKSTVRARKNKMLNLADLVSNRNASLRHHPYNFRKSTLQKAPGAMKESVLARQHGGEISSDSDNSQNGSIKSEVPQNQQVPSVMNTNASTLFLSEVQIPAANKLPNGTLKTQLSRKSRSTIILHRNPHFDPNGHKRSCILKAKSQKSSGEVTRQIGTRSSKIKQQQQQQARSSKHNAVTAADNRYIRENIGRLVNKLMAHCSGEQMPAQPANGRIKRRLRSSGMINSDSAVTDDCACPTLASILGSMEGFLKNVSKRIRDD